tara:strand:+ start:313 stop:528 length:216 start_codon:yes stop_codon:yes gene_type:complete
MSKDKIGKIFLLEYKDKPEQVYIGNKIGIILRKHKLKFRFAEESYHVLLEDKFRVIHLPNKDSVSYKIKFI